MQTGTNKPDGRDLCCLVNPKGELDAYKICAYCGYKVCKTCMMSNLDSTGYIRHIRCIESHERQKLSMHG